MYYYVFRNYAKSHLQPPTAKLRFCFQQSNFWSQVERCRVLPVSRKHCKDDMWVWFISSMADCVFALCRKISLKAENSRHKRWYTTLSSLLSHSVRIKTSAIFTNPQKHFFPLYLNNDLVCNLKSGSSIQHTSWQTSGETPHNHENRSNGIKQIPYHLWTCYGHFPSWRDIFPSKSITR